MAGEFLVPIFGIVGTFGSLIVLAYLYFSSRNRERMALIERGQDASIFYKNSQDRRSRSLKNGMLAILTGIGLFAGNVLEKLHIIDGVTAYFSMVLIFGGVGLIAYYYMENGVSPDLENNDEDNFVA